MPSPSNQQMTSNKSGALSVLAAALGKEKATSSQPKVPSTSPTVRATQGTQTTEWEESTNSTPKTKEKRKELFNPLPPRSCLFCEHSHERYIKLLERCKDRRNFEVKQHQIIYEIAEQRKNEAEIIELKSAVLIATQAQERMRNELCDTESQLFRTASSLKRLQKEHDKLREDAERRARELKSGPAAPLTASHLQELLRQQQQQAIYKSSLRDPYSKLDSGPWVGHWKKCPQEEEVVAPFLEEIEELRKRNEELRAAMCAQEERHKQSVVTMSLRLDEAQKENIKTQERLNTLIFELEKETNGKRSYAQFPVYVKQVVDVASHPQENY